MNTEDTIKVVKESIQDSIYENSKTMMRLLDKIGDIMIDKISVTTVIEQVIKHMSVFKLENYLKKQGKGIVLHNNDDIQDIAQPVQDLNTKINSLKLKSSTNN